MAGAGFSDASGTQSSICSTVRESSELIIVDFRMHPSRETLTVSDFAFGLLIEVSDLLEGDSIVSGIDVVGAATPVSISRREVHGTLR